jgi:hypothetical protein
MAAHGAYNFGQQFFAEQATLFGWRTVWWSIATMQDEWEEPQSAPGSESGASEDCSASADEEGEAQDLDQQVNTASEPGPSGFDAKEVGPCSVVMLAAYSNSGFAAENCVAFVPCCASFLSPGLLHVIASLKAVLDCESRSLPDLGSFLRELLPRTTSASSCCSSYESISGSTTRSTVHTAALYCRMLRCTSAAPQAGEQHVAVKFSSAFTPGAAAAAPAGHP